MSRILFYSIIMMGLPYLVIIGPWNTDQFDGIHLDMLILFAFQLSVFFPVYQMEEIKKLLVKKESFEHFMAKTIGLILLISIFYSSYYHAMFISNPESFSNVESKGFFTDLIQFFFFSSGITLLSRFSPIEPVSMYCQAMIFIHSLLVFSAVILVVANYREVATVSYIKGPEDDDNKKALKNNQGDKMDKN